MSRLSTILFTASLASIALAKTDLTGCTSTDVSSPAGASIAWYVPGTGELCEFLDCGGGRAPPKTTVPGCALYSGTASYSPSYLAGYGSMTASATAAPETTSSAEGASATSYGSASDSAETTETMTGAWSETSETNTSLENSAVEVTSVASSTALSVMSTIISSPTVAVIGGSNGTTTNGTTTGSGSGSNGNGTVSSPSPIMSDSGAMETARVWLGGSALVGLGAFVAAL